MISEEIGKQLKEITFKTAKGEDKLKVCGNCKWSQDIDRTDKCFCLKFMIMLKVYSMYNGTECFASLDLPTAESTKTVKKILNWCTGSDTGRGDNSPVGMIQYDNMNDLTVVQCSNCVDKILIIKGCSTIGHISVDHRYTKDELHDMVNYLILLDSIKGSIADDTYEGLMTTKGINLDYDKGLLE